MQGEKEQTTDNRCDSVKKKHKSELHFFKRHVLKNNNKVV